MVRAVRSTSGWALATWLSACGPAVDPTSASTSTGAPASTSTSTTTHGTSSGVDTTSAIDPTTSSSDTSSDAGSSETTLNFILDPDGGAPGLQCDPWSQDCSREEKCVPCTTHAPTEWFSDTCCVPIAPDPANVGEACQREEGLWSGVDNCALGSVCWFVDDALVGECVAQCEGSRANPECSPGNSCDIAYEGTTVLCLPTCDPTAPACGPDRTCAHGTRVGDSGFGHFVCQATAPLVDVVGYGESCSTFGDLCGEGLACGWPIDVPGCDASRCCTVVGTLAAPPVCPDAAQTCVAAYPDGEAPVGLEDLCYCTVPR